MDCEHRFFDSPLISDEVIKSYKLCQHCHTARIRYADGTIAYQLPLEPLHISINVEMTCGHEGDEQWTT
jgi:hypothetical protein